MNNSPTNNINKTYHVTTFGCQMNVSDSERISTIAEQLGYKQTEQLVNADLIIINSCSIRQKAEDRVMGMGKKIEEMKRNNPNLVTVLTGCMAKREPRGIEEQKANLNNINYDSKLKKVMPWLDHVITIKDMHKLGISLGYTSKSNNIKEYLSVSPKIKKSFFQYIPISTGCNKFCTFCIVPFSRGNEIYRPYTEIINELQNCISNGTKEITLLGQNVNSWRGRKDSSEYVESIDPHRLLKKDMETDVLDFADLLDEMGKLLDNYINDTGEKIWIKFTSSHPYDIDEKLINVIKSHKSIAKQIHFALQSGSNTVLKRMNRHYTSEEFKEKYYLIRNSINNVGISTDIIVGFCEETEQEFYETKELVSELKFDQAFISEYSNRKGTVASKVHKDTVSHEIKKRRKEILNSVLSEGMQERNLKLINVEMDVLIYKEGKNGLIGRTDGNKDIIIKDIFSNKSNEYIGKFLKVKVIEANNKSLLGQIL